MSYRRQKKNTTKLPRVLRDELESLGTLSKNRSLTLSGKVDPQRNATKRPQGQRPHSKHVVPKKSYPASGAPARNGGSSAELSQAWKKSARKPPVEDDVGMSEDEESLNEEDRIIADLEKKLGMDKRKSSKLGDDELDG
jgi:hypothetical protein